MTESHKGPKGFIVVLPGEIIEIPQDDDKSWLTLFYALPKELVEKFPAALQIPRCPYEVLRTNLATKPPVPSISALQRSPASTRILSPGNTKNIWTNRVTKHALLDSSHIMWLLFFHAERRNHECPKKSLQTFRMK